MKDKNKAREYQKLRFLFITSEETKVRKRKGGRVSLTR